MSALDCSKTVLDEAAQKAIALCSGIDNRRNGILVSVEATLAISELTKLQTAIKTITDDKVNDTLLGIQKEELACVRAGGMIEGYLALQYKMYTNRIEKCRAVDPTEGNYWVWVLIVIAALGTLIWFFTKKSKPNDNIV